MKLKLFLIGCTLLFSSSSFSAENTKLRLAVLAFGTVNWELSTIKNQQILAKSEIELEIIPVANAQAGKIALQSGAADIIVSDWIWVSRMRAASSDYSFYPYSNTSGALMVAANSKINSIADLSAKRLGIAGGELDKNWLLLQALASQNNLPGLNNRVTKVYAAPPLLNQQLLQQRVDAIMNYWHFAARLEAKGYRQLMNGKQLLQELGINAEVPSLGYVFNRHWANQNNKILLQFLAATRQAKNLICESDSVWKNIVPLTKSKDAATQKTLRERYCEGRIKQWGKKEQQAAEKIYQLLRKVSNNKLTGRSEHIQPGTFWNAEFK